MTDVDLPEPVERALETHESFEPAPGGYALTTTVFDSVVTAAAAAGERDARFEVIVSLPTIDAAASEPVAAVVEDGWFETLERRLRDVFSVARTSTHEDPVLERDADEVRVTLKYVSWDAREGVDDAKTLIEYVEGTYAQGIIPGYDYRGPAAELLGRAEHHGREAAGGQGTTGSDDGAPL